MRPRSSPTALMFIRRRSWKPKYHNIRHAKKQERTERTNVPLSHRTARTHRTVLPRESLELGTLKLRLNVLKQLLLFVAAAACSWCEMNLYATCNRQYVLCTSVLYRFFILNIMTGIMVLLVNHSIETKTSRFKKN